LGDAPAIGTELKVMDALGQVLYAAPVMAQKTNYDFSQLSAGTYFVQVSNLNVSTTKTIVVSQKY
jgi:hypothetical protein